MGRPNGTDPILCSGFLTFVFLFFVCYNFARWLSPILTISIFYSSSSLIWCSDYYLIFLCFFFPIFLWSFVNPKGSTLSSWALRSLIPSCTFLICSYNLEDLMLSKSNDFLHLGQWWLEFLIIHCLKHSLWKICLQGSNSAELAISAKHTVHTRSCYFSSSAGPICFRFSIRSMSDFMELKFLYWWWNYLTVFEI